MPPRKGSKAAPKPKEPKPPLTDEKLQERREKNKEAVKNTRVKQKIEEEIDKHRIDLLKETNQNMIDQMEKLNKFIEEAGQRSAAANMNNNQYRYQ